VKNQTAPLSSDALEICEFGNLFRGIATAFYILFWSRGPNCRWFNDIRFQNWTNDIYAAISNSYHITLRMTTVIRRNVGYFGGIWNTHWDTTCRSWMFRDMVLIRRASILTGHHWIKTIVLRGKADKLKMLTLRGVREWYCSGGWPFSVVGWTTSWMEHLQTHIALWTWRSSILLFAIDCGLFECGNEWDSLSAHEICTFRVDRWFDVVCLMHKP
jgi:hypothetical protein